MGTPVVTGRGLDGAYHEIKATLNTDGTYSLAMAVENQLVKPAVPPQVIGANLTSSTSQLVNAATKYVIVTSSVDAWLNISTAPVATPNASGNMFIGAGSPTYPIEVTGNVTKVAAIAHTATTGFVSITESK